MKLVAKELRWIRDIVSSDLRKVRQPSLVRPAAQVEDSRPSVVSAAARVSESYPTMATLDPHPTGLPGPPGGRCPTCARWPQLGSAIQSRACLRDFDYAKPSATRMTPSSASPAFCHHTAQDESVQKPANWAELHSIFEPLIDPRATRSRNNVGLPRHRDDRPVALYDLNADRPTVLIGPDPLGNCALWQQVAPPRRSDAASFLGDDFDSAYQWTGFGDGCEI